MLRLFKSNQPTTLVLVFLVSGLLWFKAFSAPLAYAEFSAMPQMPFYKYLLVFQGNFPLLFSILSFALVLGQGLLVNQFNARYNFLRKQSYLPFLLFLLIACGTNSAKIASPLTFANLFLIIALLTLFDSYKKRNALSNFFNASFLVSLGSLFYFPFVFAQILVFASLIYIRRFYWREWMTSIIGALTPFVIFFGGYFLLYAEEIGQLFAVIGETMSRGMKFNYPTVLNIQILSGAMVLLWMFASAELVKNFPKRKISIRKYFSIFLWTLIVGLAFSLLLITKAEQILIVIALPLSYLYSNYFYFSKKKALSEAFFALLFLIVVVGQFIDLSL